MIVTKILARKRKQMNQFKTLLSIKNAIDSKINNLLKMQIFIEEAISDPDIEISRGFYNEMICKLADCNIILKETSKMHLHFLEECHFVEECSSCIKYAKKIKILESELRVITIERNGYKERLLEVNIA